MIFDGLPSGNLDVQHVYIHNYVYICIINIYVKIYIYTYISKLLIFIDDQSQTCFASNKIEGLSFPLKLSSCHDKDMGGFGGRFSTDGWVYNSRL